VTERIPKGVLIAGAILVPLVLAFFAYSQPGYFSSQPYLEGLLLIELLIAAVWMYRQVFFPVTLIAFLFAGSSLPVGGGWTVARWIVLGVGALVGCVMILKDHRYHFGLFHVIAAFAILAAMVSSAVSRYQSFALLKALSLLLLFLYGGTGARLALAGREGRFFAGLLTGCEIFVGAMTACYLVGLEVMGNANSLGAVMGVVCAPVLLWGALVSDNPSVHRRRIAVYVICMGLVFFSRSRAGIVAALVACGLLCLASRKYKLFTVGLGAVTILIATTAIAKPEVFSNTVSSVTSMVVYKGKDPALGLFASRQTPWQAAVESINNHFWFGTGFGTTDNGQDVGERLNQFSTNPGVTAENGSSYLAILTWVGMMGVVPFLFLVLALVAMVSRTLRWMFRTASLSHPAIPLAMVMVAGLIHAGFEDWLFAPGYYLCVFFWSMAFAFADVAPSAALSRLATVWGSRPVGQRVADIAASR